LRVQLYAPVSHCGLSRDCERRLVQPAVVLDIEAFCFQ
jgi:hypothetical protein